MRQFQSRLPQVKCEGPLCDKNAGFVVIKDEGTEKEKSWNMCFDCAKARKTTIEQYGHKAIITAPQSV